MGIRSIFKVSILLFLSVVLTQSCGTIQKRRYSNGWSWNLELHRNKNQNLEIKAIKAEKVKIVSGNTAENILSEINTPIIGQHVETTNDLNLVIKRKIEIERNIQLKISDISLSKKENTKDEIKAGQLNDNLGYFAFISFWCSALFLLLTLISFAPILSFIGILGICFFLLSVILLIIRSSKFKNNQDVFYKNKGFGVAAIVMVIIGLIFLVDYIIRDLSI